MAAYTFANARRTVHRPPLVGVDHGLCTLVVFSCCSDVTAETASAVVGQSDSGVASEVAVSAASVSVRRVVSTERQLLCNHCGHGLLAFTLNERK